MKAWAVFINISFIIYFAVATDDIGGYSARKIILWVGSILLAVLVFNLIVIFKDDKDLFSEWIYKKKLENKLSIQEMEEKINKNKK